LDVICTSHDISENIAYLALSNNRSLSPFKYTSNMNAFLSFDLFMVYIPECKQQLRTMN